jgi:DUF438 domain-containing protein
MAKETSALLREILTKAEAGVSPQDLAETYQEELAPLDESELALAESRLLAEGYDPAKLSRLCDVHAAVYLAEKRKAAAPQGEKRVTTPLRVLAAENEGIESALSFLKTTLQEELNPSAESGLFQAIRYLAALGDHYSQKETLYFPYLIRHGVDAPVHVMWGVDDEIRDKLRTLLSFETPKDLAAHLPLLQSFLEQAESMRTKEEKILIPLLEQQLTPDDFEAIARELPSLGYAFLAKGPSLKDFGLDEKPWNEGDIRVNLPTGELSLKELVAILNGLDVELTYIDQNGKFRYFNQGKKTTFIRTKAELNEDVEDCHPLRAVPAVREILTKLAKGEKDVIDFSLKKKGKAILNRYVALHDEKGSYLGCLEITRELE